MYIMKASNIMVKVALVFFLFQSYSAKEFIQAQSFQKKNNRNSVVMKVKVAVVFENPVLPQFGNKKMYQCFHTPGLITRLWNDPEELSQEYEKCLEEVSGNTIDYEVVKKIDADKFFTFLKNDPLKRSLTRDEIATLLFEPDWKTLKDIGTSYDYNKMVKYYGFDKMRDNGEINEIWVWTFPYCGMWESHMMGKNAFWINSNPNENPSCTELLSIMGLNYERDLACAMESYGHRFESTMMQVYGWWNYDNKAKTNELTNWERYAGYVKNYEKFNPGNTHIGNIHFPPNGEFDYDWKNEKMVNSFADEWLNYPDVKENKSRKINCSEWNCNHLGYMKWWFSHIPHFIGINSKDGKLNNWWHYVVDYNKALIEE